MRVWYSLISLAAIAAPAAGVVTPAGNFYLLLSGTTAAQDPQLAGTVVRDDLVPFVMNDATKTHGTIQVRTVKRATGQLSFYWKINVAADAKGGVEVLHIHGFPNHGYQADWRPDGLGTVAPAGIGGAIATAGDYGLYFQFGKPIGPGQSSRFLYVKTNATKAGKGFVILGGSGGLSTPIKGDAPVLTLNDATAIRRHPRPGTDSRHSPAPPSRRDARSGARPN